MTVMTLPTLVRSALPTAELWVASASAGLAKRSSLAKAALGVNFGFGALSARERTVHRAWVVAAFVRIAKLLRSASTFKSVTPGRARALFGAGPPPPAFTFGGGNVFVTASFADFGVKCRAAMLIHETVHVFDPRSGEPEHHVSEWDERFDRMTPEQQLHNPSAYASFAAQVFHGALAWPREERYGAGRPRE